MFYIFILKGFHRASSGRIIGSNNMVTRVLIDYPEKQLQDPNCRGEWHCTGRKRGQ